MIITNPLTKGLLPKTFIKHIERLDIIVNDKDIGFVIVKDKCASQL